MLYRRCPRRPPLLHRPDFCTFATWSTARKTSTSNSWFLSTTVWTATKDGDQVWVFKVADSTACINFAIIGDAGRHLKPGDICKVLNGFCSMFKGALTFYVGKSGTFRRTGEFCFLTTEELNMSVQKTPQSVTQSPGSGSGETKRSSDPSHRAGASPQSISQSQSVNQLINQSVKTPHLMSGSGRSAPPPTMDQQSRQS